MKREMYIECRDWQRGGFYVFEYPFMNGYRVPLYGQVTEFIEVNPF